MSNAETKEEIAKGSTGDITLYAIYSRVDYTITYNNTQGAVNANPSGYNVDTTTIPLSILTRTGYEFVGWFTQASGGEKVEEIAKGSTGNIILYARWSVTDYSVKYNNTKDATNTNPGGYNVDTETFALNDLSKDGYKFVGWFTEETGGAEVEEIAKGSTGDLTLYARWSTDSYKITYNNTKDATNANQGNYTIETATFTLADLSKDYYTFVGWFDALEGGNEVEEITLGSTGDKVLYARWTADDFTITYNGATDEEHTNQKTYNIDSETITLLAPERLGYDFDGWFDALEGGNEVKEIVHGSTGEKTFYARWSPSTFSIRYEGTKDAPNTNQENYTIETATFALTDISKEYYTFVGWFDALEGGNEVEEITLGSTGDRVLYARWTADDFTITYIDTSNATQTPASTYNIEDEINTLPTPVRLGYTFVGWYDADTAGNKVAGISIGTIGNITLYARWEKDTYSITYVDSSNETQTPAGSYNVDSEINTLPTPVRLGYTFLGWYDADTDGNKVNGITIGTTGNITLYAKWTLQNFAITYIDTSNATQTPASTYNIEDEIHTLPTPVRLGYTFVGWYDADTAGNKVDGISIGTTGNMTLYARWEKDTYSITYVDSSNETQTPAGSYDVDSEISTLPTPVRLGYTFLGWYDADTDGNQVNGIAKGTTGNITLYARWELEA